MPPIENGMGMNHSMGLFGGLFNQSGHGSMDPSSSFMERTIANPIRAGESSDQFSFKRGRRFTGTSQQSGEPSMRVQLSIISVKDRGTSVTARLASLDSSRLSRNYNGLIETNPLRLTLIPEAQSNGFSTFVTYQPWHSNSPTRISLEINSEKGLSGTSGSGERFELFAEPEPQPNHATARNFSGFETRGFV